MTSPDSQLNLLVCLNSGEHYFSSKTTTAEKFQAEKVIDELLYPSNPDIVGGGSTLKYNNGNNLYLAMNGLMNRYDMSRLLPQLRSTYVPIEDINVVDEVSRKIFFETNFFFSWFFC